MAAWLLKSSLVPDGPEWSKSTFSRILATKQENHVRHWHFSSCFHIFFRVFHQKSPGSFYLQISKKSSEIRSRSRHKMRQACRFLAAGTAQPCNSCAMNSLVETERCEITFCTWLGLSWRMDFHQEKTWSWKKNMLSWSLKNSSHHPILDMSLE